jgi:hypothetical protein
MSFETTFETVVDQTCKILEEKQVQYSLRRLSEFDYRLECLERELDFFIEKYQNVD